MLKLLCRNANAFFSLILLAGLSACTLDVKILDKDGQSSKIAPPQNKTATITIAPSYINSNNQSILNLGGTCTGMSSLKVRIGTISTTANCNSSNWSTIIDVSALPDQTIQIVLEEPTSSTNLASLNIEKDTQVLAPASLNDMNFGTLASTARFKWSPIVDAASGVAAYEIAIGTTSGGTEILDWFDVGNLSEFSKAGLSGLSNGNTYYTSVRVKDLAGNVSSPTAGDGWLAIDKMKLQSTPLISSNDYATEIAISPDGSPFAVGPIDNSGIQAPRATMLSSMGQVVTDFNLGLGFDQRVLTSDLQADGKILVGGWFMDFQGHECIGIARMNADGSRDTSFIGATGTTDAQFEKVKVLSDGKILAAGWVTNYNGASVQSIVKLNADGTLIPAFNPSFDDFSKIQDFEVQSDGKIVIIGDFTSVNGNSRSHIARLNADGSLDSTFTPGTGFPTAGDWVETIAIQSDGKIVVGGGFSTYNGATVSKLIRINSDGTRDATLSTGSGITGGNVYAIFIDEFAIYIGGDFTNYNGGSARTIAKLSSTGVRDASFSTNIGLGAQFAVNVILKNAAGKLVVGGEFATFNSVTQNDLVWLNTDGTVATGYPSGNLFGWLITTLIELPNDNLFVGGWFEIANWDYNYGVLKLDPSLNKDPGFSLLTASGEIQAIAFTSSNKILLGGTFPNYGGLGGTNKMVSLNADGTRDTSFDVGTGFNNAVNEISVQSDGKFVVAGDFTNFKGIVQNRIARLNSDGTLDASLVIGAGINGSIYELEIQPDGKILAAGAFTSYDSTTVNRLIRINSDGSLDSTFNIGTGPDANIKTIKIQPDGKILLGGYFTTFNGQNYTSLVRLNSNGSVDTSFSQHSFSSGVEDIETQSDGKILIVGDFKAIDLNPIALLARLNDDGTIDDSFLLGSGPSIDYSSGATNSVLNAIAVLSNGEIIVGGDSTMSFDGKVSGALYKLGW